MKALLFDSPGRVSYTDRPDPVLEEPGDVLIRVELTAICGSDLHVYRGHETGLDPGTILGHEMLGRVVEAAPEVRGLRRGDRVVAPFTTNCGRCFFCRQGLTCRCENGRLFGWVERGEGLEGVQAELVRVPLAEATLVKVPDDARPEEALLAGDVLATGTFGVDLAGGGPGKTVAVVGCGPVGLMAVVGARERGAERVFAVDQVAERLDLARRLGAEALDLGDDPVEAVRQATAGRGADAVVEAVGSPGATRTAVDLARIGGSIGAVGVHNEPRLAVSPGELYDKNLSYRAGRCPARAYMSEALEWIGSGRHDLASIVSHRLPLAEGPRAYRLFDQRLEACTKVVLRP